MLGFRAVRTFAVLLITMLLVVGCGTVAHKVSLEQGYRIEPGTKVTLGPVKNKTGKSFDIAVEKMLADALAQTLKDRNLNWTNDPSPKLVLTTDIVEYSKGDAFKRWLLPGWGSTVLVVRATLADNNNRNVGVVEAKRTVDVGGVYTIGAWKTVFNDLAQDVVTDLGAAVVPAGTETQDTVGVLRSAKEPSAAPSSAPPSTPDQHQAVVCQMPDGRVVKVPRGYCASHKGVVR